MTLKILKEEIARLEEQIREKHSEVRELNKIITKYNNIIRDARDRYNQEAIKTSIKMNDKTYREIFRRGKIRYK
jgi:hypothetical protein